MPDNLHEQFESLLLDTQDMIYSLGMRLFHNPEDALDFSQEVYLRAFDKLDSFQGKSKFSTWLYSLALHYGLNQLRKKKKLKFQNIGEEDFLDKLDTSGPGPNENSGRDPYSILEKEDFRDLVYQELDNLPEVYRLPLTLFYYEHMSYDQIADALKTKMGTVKSYIHRGKGLLRTKLMERGVTGED